MNLSDGSAADLLMLFEDLIDDEADGTNEINLFLYPAALLAESRLTLRVDGSLPAEPAPLPETLTTITRSREDEIVRTREFNLTMDHSGGRGADGSHAGHAKMDMASTGRPWT